MVRKSGKIPSGTRSPFTVGIAVGSGLVGVKVSGGVGVADWVGVMVRVGICVGDGVMVYDGEGTTGVMLASIKVGASEPGGVPIGGNSVEGNP